MKKPINLLMGQQKKEEQKEVNRIRGRDIAPKSIRPLHISSNLFLIQVGLASERPTSGDEVRFFFASDTFIMSYWDTDSKTWKSGSAFS